MKKKKPISSYHPDENHMDNQEVREQTDYPPIINTTMPERVFKDVSNTPKTSSKPVMNKKRSRFS